MACAPVRGDNLRALAEYLVLKIRYLWIVVQVASLENLFH